jgi:Na+-driven multidrug efflux pump
MNVGGLLLLRFIGSLEHSAEAQAAYAVGYNQLFSLITWTSVGLMGAAATVAGQNLGAGRPERSVGGLQGTGDTRSPFYISLVSQVAVPLGLCLVLQALGMLAPLGIWIAILLGHVTRAALSIVRFRQGKWRSIEVGVAPAGAR